MSYKFNPFTGNFDIVGSASGGTGDPGGSTTQVQFNDAGVFGGDTTFTFNKTTDTLSLSNLTASGTTTLSGGTANGVVYLNASKQVTTGTGLVFDGTNLGIGTSLPGQKLEVQDGNSQVRNSTTQTQGTVLSYGLTFRSSNQIGQDRGTIAAIKPYFGTASDNDFGLAFQTQATTAGGVTTKALLDPSGNLGLGVTPSAWGSNYIAMQVAGGAGLMGSSSGAWLAGNCYFDNTNWRYVTTNNATMLNMAANGTFNFFTAPSGTAGAAISFTQAMTLDASGNLILGHGNGLKFDFSPGSIAKNGLNYVQSSPDSFTDIYGCGLNSGWAGAIRFFTSNNAAAAERVRIKSAGQVRFVPLASAPSGAESGDVYYNSTDNKLYCYNGSTWNALF